MRAWGGGRWRGSCASAGIAANGSKRPLWGKNGSGGTPNVGFCSAPKAGLGRQRQAVWTLRSRPSKETRVKQLTGRCVEIMLGSDFPVEADQPASGALL